MDWLLNDLPLLVDQWGMFMAIGLFAIIIISGFGLPMPEDIPLMALGYLCYREVMPLSLMLPLALLSVLLGDWVMYFMGRRFGTQLTKIPPFKWFLSPKRLAAAHKAFHDHGGKALFTARFLPGIRSAVFFSAGHFRLPFWKMLVYDGSAALISVPVIILLAYFFGSQLERVRHWTQQGHMVVLAGIIALVTCVVLIKLVRQRRNQTKLPKTGVVQPLQ
ncbi:MAG: DedA family protein [Phycisphaerales bacterium]|nr:DedA family protein [Phycisphaerales bacterium]